MAHLAAHAQMDGLVSFVKLKLEPEHRSQFLSQNPYQFLYQFQYLFQCRFQSRIQYQYLIQSRYRIQYLCRTLLIRQLLPQFQQLLPQFRQHQHRFRQLLLQFQQLLPQFRQHQHRFRQLQYQFLIHVTLAVIQLELLIAKIPMARSKHVLMLATVMD